MDNKLTAGYRFNSNLHEYVVTTNKGSHRVVARSSKAAIEVVERIDQSGWISVTLSNLN